MIRTESISVSRPGVRALAVLLLSVSGCIDSEVTEIVAERVDKSDAWTITYTFDGLFSDSEDPEVQQRDFLDIVKSWKGDLDVDSEVRDLGLSKGGRLVGHMKARVKVEDLFHDGGWVIDSLGYHIPVEPPDSIVHTNGTVELRGKARIVTWSPQARRLELKVMKAGGTYLPRRSNLIPYYQACIESTSVSK
jgi:hypothetical protein